MRANSKILHAGQGAGIACSPGGIICIQDNRFRIHKIDSKEKEELVLDSFSASSNIERMKVDFPSV